MTTVAERVRGLEERTECLPSLRNEVEEHGRQLARLAGMGAMLRAILGVALGEGALLAIVLYLLAQSGAGHP